MKRPATRLSLYASRVNTRVCTIALGPKNGDKNLIVVSLPVGGSGVPEVIAVQAGAAHEVTDLRGFQLSSNPIFLLLILCLLIPEV